MPEPDIANCFNRTIHKSPCTSTQVNLIADHKSRITSHRLYFGDQLGDSFCPSLVNCRAEVPSASMDQICRVPVRVDSNTRWRPSGAQLGRSLRPTSRVNSTNCRVTISI